MRYYKSETVRIVYESKRLVTGLTDCKITIWDATPTKQADAQTMTELGNGLYYYDYTPLTTGVHIFFCDSATQPRRFSGQFIIEDSTDLILKILKNKWKIEGNQLKIYDNDKTTVLYTFDLKDSAGSASSTDVFERGPA